MTQHWLLKTEPEEWSWTAQVKKGVEAWTGVRNHQAAKHLRGMAVGDRCFFYHTGGEKQVVGIVKVARTAYTDPTDEAGKFVAVDVRTDRPFKRPVTLAEIKAEPKLAEILLVRHSRLSVMPIDEKSWALICKMGDTAP